jgi:hypothetical protein
VAILPSEAYAQLAASGKSLTVTTPNTVATFAGADLVGFRNALTNELYLKNPSAGELAYVNTITSNGQSLQTSNWTIGTEAGTGIPIARITVSDSTRTLTLTVKIDASTNEIVIKSAASISAAGLRDASWSIAGLDLAGGRLIVPAFTGMVFDAAHPPFDKFLEYPKTWHAQMAVYEAALGSFILYSNDTQMVFKQLRSTTRGSAAVDLAVVTEAIAPFTTATTVPAIEWRLKAFAGDWRKAAQVYRDWLAVNRPPVSNAQYPWVTGIRAVAGIGRVDESLLAPLAAKVVPSQTLLYLHDWRVDAYDVNYPDYTPRSGVQSFITNAHALGFKVMLHFDMIAVSPVNSDYSSVQAYQVRDPETLQQLGQSSDPFVVIDPASSVYRSLFISRVSSAVNAVHPDALHLDISAPMANDGNGPIDGLTYALGAAQLHQDLIAAFPNLALGGEGENDMLYRYQSFAQLWWDGDVQATGHPIVNFLFSPQIQFYGSLGQPLATEPTFKNYLSQIEHRSILPKLGIAFLADLDTTNPDNARLIGVIQSWQDHAFQPDWNADWTGALVRYSGMGNTTAALTDSGTLEALTGAGATLYQLSHDVNQLVTPSFVPYWPAFDGAVLYGFDPAQRYWLDSAARPATSHVTSLPQGDLLGVGTLISSGFGLVEINSPASNPFDFFGNLFLLVQGVRYQGTDGPLTYGAAVYPSPAAPVGGIDRRALTLVPPYQAQIGGETFVQYSVAVPTGGRFQFSVGIWDGASCTDGITFRVTVNGAELYKQTFGLGAWHDGVVDLSQYAGSTVALRIINNPGPQGNPGCDYGFWSQLELVSAPTMPTISVPLTLANGVAFSGFTGDGSFTLNTPQSATVSSLPVPGRFIVFTQAGTAVSSGTNLLNVPFESWTSAPGQLAVPAAAIYAGIIGSAPAGGVTKNPALHVFPPNGGRTILSWVLRLPNSGGLRLGWSVGIQDGNPSHDGIDFLVLVNGVPYWQLTKNANSWSSGNIDLQQWQGQNVLVELITDSRADNGSDAAVWSDLVLSASTVTCSYSIQSGTSTGAQGGQFSLNVTAPATCPWSATRIVSWLSITPPDTGIGNGTVSYSVAPNSGLPRSGALVIAGHAFVVNQADSNGILPRKERSQVTSQ